MKKFRNFIVSLVFLVTLNSCGAIKDGFSLQKKDNTDEFLVQKKNPLKLPPNFNELPKPNTGNTIDDNNKNSEIKSLLKISENDSNNNGNNNGSTSKNLQDLLLDKIKNN